MSGQPQPEIVCFQNQKNYTASDLHMDVKMDSDGMTWIIQVGDILRYDGESFVKITSDLVDHSSYIKFFEDPSGNKYVIDLSNRLFYIEEDTLRPYPMNDTLKRISKNIFCEDFYFDESESLHISFKDGKYLVIDSAMNIEFPYQQQLSQINGFGLFLRKNKRPFFVNHTSKNLGSPKFACLINEEGKLIQKFPILDFNGLFRSSITPLPNGNYLLASGRGHLIEFSDSAIIKQFPIEGWGGIIGLFVDSKDGLWISTTEGIRYYKSYETIGEDHQLILPGTFSVAVAEDFQNGIWIQSQEKGLGRIAYPNHLMYSKENGMLYSNHIRKLISVGPNLYVGNEIDSLLSVVNINNQNVSTLNIPQESKTLGSIYYNSTHKRMWIGRRGHLFYSTHSGWNRLNTDEVIKSGKGGVFNLLQKPFHQDVHNGRQIVLLRNKFFYVNDTTIDYISKEYPYRINDLTVVGDSIWLTTLGGVYLQVGEKIYDMSEQYKELGSHFTYVSCFNNKIWFSSLRTQHVYTLDKNGLKEVKVNGKSIPGSVPILTNKNELWFFSSTMTCLFSNLKEPNHETNTNLSIFPPYPKAYSYETGTYSNEKGIFWAEKGVGIFNTKVDDIKRETFKVPRLHIKRVEINNIAQSNKDHVFHLKHDQNYIKLSYVGINFSAFPVQYRYRMPGIDTTWKLTNERSIQFIELPPGNYTVELQTQLVDQVWGLSKILEFNIVPPFWNTWWFYTIGFFLSLFLFYQLINYRIGVQNREKTLVIKRLVSDQKALRAKMDPHFIFNVLTSLQYLISHNMNEKASSFLDKFSGLMRGTLDQISTEFISIENEIIFLKEYLDLELIRFENKFNYSIDVAPNVHLNSKIPNLIIQPIVENAVLHGLKNKNGHKGVLEIKFKKTQQFIEVTITDNGVGYERTLSANKTRKRQRKSYGIQTIIDRLALHNNKNKKIKSFTIQDLGLEGKETGTLVTMLIRQT